MWISDCFETETLEDLAHSMAAYHYDNDLEGEPKLNMLYYYNGVFETKATKEIILKVEQEALEWLKTFNEAAKDEACYVQECNRLIYDRI